MNPNFENFSIHYLASWSIYRNLNEMYRSLPHVYSKYFPNCYLFHYNRDLNPHKNMFTFELYAETDNFSFLILRITVPRPSEKQNHNL